MNCFRKIRVMYVMLFAALSFVLAGCGKTTENPPEVPLSNECAILAISFVGQIGTPTITAASHEVSFTFNATTGNVASVEVQALTISAAATATAKVGDKLNFSTGNTANITVTAEDGKTSQVWKLNLTPYVDNPDLNITGISFDGQIGEVQIDSETATIEFWYNENAGSYASVEVVSIVVSGGSTASVAAGDHLSFTGTQATITVTSGSSTRDWTVTLKPFTEALEGTWNIKNMWLYGGEPMYNCSAVFFLNQKSGNWSQETGPIAENDNVLVFTLEGIDEDGNSYGTVVNDAGDDELFADFNYQDTWDLNYIYRVIPEGEAKWKRNIETGIVTFIFPDDSERQCKFGGPDDFNDYTFQENEDQGGSFKAPMLSDGEKNLTAYVESLMNNMSFMFDVNGMGVAGEDVPGYDTWDFVDDAKYLVAPHFVWVEVEKVE